MLFVYFLCYLISAVNPDTVDPDAVYPDAVNTEFVPSVQHQSFSCSLLSETQQSPFVVILLYQSSGHFLGMGGILDKATVLTSTSAIKMAEGKVSDILVLAGYFSPWWGENAQVRRARTIYVSEFEVTLVEIEPDLIFSKRISPLRLEKLSHGDTHYTVYGISVNKSPKSGEPVEKTAFYQPKKYPSTSLNDCVPAFPSVSDLTQKTHVCLFMNNSLCEGSLGSPVTGAQNYPSNPYILGVIIKTECSSQETLMVKVTTFLDWITYINVNRK